jgi:hypothetical protein
VPTPDPARGLLRVALLLLGLLTLVTFIGPFVAFFILRGGESPEWPPDRPVEWWAVGLTSVLGLALTMACIATAFVARARLGQRR